MDAVKQMGDTARAVVVLNEDVTVDEIKSLYEQGARGVRFNIVSGAGESMLQIARMAEKIYPFGWHMVFWMKADMVVEYEKELNHLPCQIVFDHRGHLPSDQGINHEAFSIISDMMRKKHAFVKLSALYHDSGQDDYSDTVAVGKAYAEVDADQLLWATDWPHHSEFVARKPMPDDAKLLDSFAEQVPDGNIRNKILVENPARLYGF